MINLKLALSEIKKRVGFCGVLPLKTGDFKLFKDDESSAHYDFENKTFTISYKKESDIFRLIFETFSKSLHKDFDVEIDKKIEDLSLMIDVARNNVLKVETFKTVICYMALCGYDSLRIYLEDVFEIPEEPYFGHFRGKYSKEEIREIIDYADVFGIKVIPCIQTLAHLKTLKRWCVYREHFDINDVLLVDDSRTYELIENMIKTVKDYFKTDFINIGMDEAHYLGRGKYLNQFGYQSRQEIFFKHLEKVQKILKKYDLKAEMWSDMVLNYFSKKEKELENIKIDTNNLNLIYWDYDYREIKEYEKILDKHLKISDKISVAGGSWKWLGFIPNNRYAIDHNKNLIRAVKNKHIQTYILTCWGDNGGETSIFAVLPTIFEVSNLICHGQNYKNYELFKCLTKIEYRDFMKIDYVNKTKDTFTKDDLNSLNRIYLYNDVLLGIFDSCVRENQVEIYDSVLNDLSKIKEESYFYYIFKNAINVTKVLKNKVSLALNLRKNYQNRDIEKLKNDLEIIKETKILLDDFYNSFYDQRHKESKPNGFDVEDIRLGALKQRIESSIRKISDFIDKKIDKIDELEEKALDFHGKIDEFIKPDILVDPYYIIMSTVNVNE